MVVRSVSIDGAATLTVRGGSSGDALAVAFDGEAYTVSSAIPLPDGNAQGCESPGGATVRCAAGVKSILIATDGGADTVRIDSSVPAGAQVRIHGGSGADSLHGGPGPDVIEAGDDSDPDLLDGGAGGDALIGARTDLQSPLRSGRSVLLGGPGSDLLVGGDPCDGDRFDGGGGNDTASFVRFNPGVRAQIGGSATRGGGDCSPGSVDDSVEALEGSAGNDTLVGDGGANTISGRGGNDTVRGRGGPDRLVGGSGGDRLIGGAGRDSKHQ